jgi:hypothetical protein
VATLVAAEIMRSNDQVPGDWGVMIALGPDSATEVALLTW